MRLFGFEITKSAGGLAAVPYSNPYSFFGPIREAFPGAWQKNAYPEMPKNLFAFSAVYACISLIAGDVAKLRPMLTEDSGNGYWIEATSNTSHVNVLSKPNDFQTRIQFLHQWITSKLLYGNAYILKGRQDLRGIVTHLYVLDPRLVVPLVALDGSVYYQLKIDRLSGLTDEITVPASEIIHDRMITPWHPLVGVSPIFACGAAATQGIRIQENSARFFENMSRPSGMLTAPGKIADETAKRLKIDFETNFSVGNIGRLWVAGDGLSYSGFSMPAEDAQLIQQLSWTIADVARCFQVPLHKIDSVPGGRTITYASIGAQQQDYYIQTLQYHIESLELLLDEGLSLPSQYHVTLDLDGLLRLDPAARIDAAQKGVAAGIYSPNEGRLKENLPPVEGGDTPYLQIQNSSLAWLAKRDAIAPVPATPATPAALPAATGDAPAASAAEDQALALANALIAKFTKAPLHA